MARNDFDFKFDEKSFDDALEFFKDAHDSIDDKWLKSTIRRKARPMEKKMKRDSHSKRLAVTAIGITTAKTKTPLIKIGVVKNDKTTFPNITSYGLAAILEYGTPERFRAAKKLGIVTGKISTGRIEPRKYAWLRSAWDAEEDKMADEVIDTIIKKIERETK